MNTIEWIFCSVVLLVLGYLAVQDTLKDTPGPGTPKGWERTWIYVADSPTSPKYIIPKGGKYENYPNCTFCGRKLKKQDNCPGCGAGFALAIGEFQEIPEDLQNV